MRKIKSKSYEKSRENHAKDQEKIMPKMKSKSYERSRENHEKDQEKMSSGFATRIGSKQC